MAEAKKELTFLGHLEELRWTLVRSAAAVLVGTVLAFIYKDIVFDSIILAPQRANFITYRALCELTTYLGLDRTLCADNLGFTLINTSMGGQFMTHISVSMAIGIILAVPYILWEIWRFVRPGLAPTEQKAVRGVVFYASLLFLAGVVFGYFVLAPMSIQFLGTYEVSASIPNMVNLNSYIGTLTADTIWTGLVFELPLVILFLARIGIVGPEFLRTYRRHAYILILIVGAIITPPDVTSQLLVSIPLIALYEGSIFLAARALRAKERAEAKAVKTGK